MITAPDPPVAAVERGHGRPAVVTFWWTAGISLRRLTVSWLDRLTERERTTFLGIRFDDDRRDYLAAHVLVRRVLADLMGVDPETIRIDHDRHGRLSTEITTAHLSLSHTRGLVVCAIGPSNGSTGIGVDAEPLESASRLETIRDVYLSTTECRWVDADPVARASRLVQQWTAKEALLKSLGRGLGGPGGVAELRSTICEPVQDPAVTARFTSRDGATAWTWCVGASHVVAFAQQGADRPAPILRPVWFG